MPLCGGWADHVGWEISWSEVGLDSFSNIASGKWILGARYPKNGLGLESPATMINPPWKVRLSSVFRVPFRSLT